MRTSCRGLEHQVSDLSWQRMDRFQKVPQSSNRRKRIECLTKTGVGVEKVRQRNGFSSTWERVFMHDAERGCSSDTHCYVSSSASGMSEECVILAFLTFPNGPGGGTDRLIRSELQIVDGCPFSPSRSAKGGYHERICNGVCAERTKASAASLPTLAKNARVY